MAGITVSDCTSALASRTALVENIVSILVPAILSIASFTVIKPLLQDNDVVDKCSKKGQLKRSVLSFQIAATISTFSSLIMTLISVIVTMTHKQKSVKDYVALMSKVKLGVVLVKTSILLAVISSASVALGTYATCMQEHGIKNVATTIINKIEKH
jgi:lysylphosphatidylglycerol synthetase-like protein (DUF2156 family)